MTDDNEEPFVPEPPHVDIENLSPHIVLPQNDSERMLVLGIQTVLGSPFANKISGAAEKFAEAQLKQGEADLQKSINSGKEIDLQKSQMESFKSHDMRYRIDKYIKFLSIIILLFILHMDSINVIDTSAFRAILFTAIGFFINDNWSDISKFFEKKKT